MLNQTTLRMSQCAAHAAPSFTSNWTLQIATIHTAATSAADSKIPPNALRAAEGNRGWRYFTAFRCGEDVCIVFKDDTKGYPHRWVGGVRSRNGLHFSEVFLVLPADLPWSKLAHNLAILPYAGGYIIVGGTHSPEHAKERYNAPYNEPWNDGVYTARGSSWCLTSECQPLRLDVDAFPAWDKPHVQWRGLRKAFSGTHQGCVEVRTTHRTRANHVLCEFDGRFSLVHFNGSFLLYARANAGFMNPKGMNGRFVQVTRSSDLEHWSPFELVQMPGWHVRTERTDNANIYFFGVQVNPVDTASLLAVYPLAHNAKGCVAMSISRDGMSWSHPTPLLASPLDSLGKRTTIQPAGPALVRLGDRIFLYLHLNVPGLTLTKKIGPPRIGRYEISAAQLRDWSMSILQDPTQFDS